jgi:4-diphosphocytidyl-2C-methyl-D-erythritol kinase
MANEKQNTEISKGIIAKAMDWAYAKAIGGLTGVDSAYELGNDFLKQKGTLEEQVDALIKWQVAKAATSGFVTGLGGIAVLPLTLPANIASVIYIQIRMITAIAYMGGHDIQEDRVKSMVYISMAGNGAKELLKEVTVKAGEKLLSKIVEKVSTHIAGKSTASLGKAVPLVGGIIGGSYDAITTRIIGKVAKKIFITTPPHYDDQNS